MLESLGWQLHVTAGDLSLVLRYPEDAPGCSVQVCLNAASFLGHLWSLLCRRLVFLFVLVALASSSTQLQQCFSCSVEVARSSPPLFCRHGALFKVARSALLW